MSQQNNLEEGIFSGERRKYRISADTPDEAREKLANYLKQNKEYKPKPTTKAPMMAASGRYYYEISANVKSTEEDNILSAAAKAAGKLAGAAWRHSLGTKKEIITAQTETGIKRKYNNLKKEFKGVGWIKEPYEKDGKWQAQVEYVPKSKEQKKADEAQKQADKEKRAAARAKEGGSKPTSNIEKQYRKLSGKDQADIDKAIETKLNNAAARKRFG